MTPSIHRKRVTVQVKEFENIHQPCPCLCTVYGKGTWLLDVLVNSHDTHTKICKFVYKALTLHSKQVLLKHDQSRSQKSVV